MNTFQLKFNGTSVPALYVFQRCLFADWLTDSVDGVSLKMAKPVAPLDEGEKPPLDELLPPGGVCYVPVSRPDARVSATKPFQKRPIISCQSGFHSFACEQPRVAVSSFARYRFYSDWL